MSIKDVIESKLVVYNVRYWELLKLENPNKHYLGETLEGSTVAINPKNYRKLERKFRGFDVYAIK